MGTRTRKGRRAFGATRRLPSGRWQASYLGPDGVRRIALQTFPEAADANVWLSTVEASMAGGDWRAPELSRGTFGSYGERWLLQRRDLRPSTRELYGFLWRKWLEPPFGNIPIGVAKHRSVARLVPTADRRASWLYPAGQGVQVGVSDAQHCGRGRAPALQPPKVKGAGAEHAPERPVALPDEVAKLASVIHPKYRAMVLLAAYCSLRFGELAGLRRSRLDLLHRTVTVDEAAVELSGGRVLFGPPKTSASRRCVSVPPELVPLIHLHLAEHVGTKPDAVGLHRPRRQTARTQQVPPHMDRSLWCRRGHGAPLPRPARLRGDVGGGERRHGTRGDVATWAHDRHCRLRYQHANQERDRAIAEKLGAFMRSASAQSEDPGGTVLSITPRAVSP